jgi:quercetin dioxygenase-like cupin family protein
MDTDDYLFRETEFGDMHVELGKVNTEIDVTPLLKGLPNDRCQAPHWGYLFKGRVRVNYGDREEIIEAGDTYYMEPGHTAVIEAGTEFVEFSPKEELAKTMEVFYRNMQKMQEQE